MKKPKLHVPRKLLVAAIGVATINYVASTACGGAIDGVGEGRDDKRDYPPTSGNLPAPDPTDYPPPTSGNLVAPVPVDSGKDVQSSDAKSDAQPSDAGGDG